MKKSPGDNAQRIQRSFLSRIYTSDPNTNGTAHVFVPTTTNDIPNLFIIVEVFLIKPLNHGIVPVPQRVKRDSHLRLNLVRTADSYLVPVFIPPFPRETLNFLAILDIRNKHPKLLQRA